MRNQPIFILKGYIKKKINFNKRKKKHQKNEDPIEKRNNTP